MKKISFVLLLLFTLAYPVGVLAGSYLYQGEWTLYHRGGAYGNYPAWYRERWPGECYGNFCRRARLYSVYAQSLWAWDPFRYVGKWDRWYAYIPGGANPGGDEGALVRYYVHEGTSHSWWVAINQRARAGQWVYLGYSDTNNTPQGLSIDEKCWYYNHITCGAFFAYWDLMRVYDR